MDLNVYINQDFFEYLNLYLYLEGFISFLNFINLLYYYYFFLILGDIIVVFIVRLLFDIEFLVIGMVIFDDVFLNLGNVYNERNGYFIVYVVGIYQFVVFLINFGKEVYFVVQKNGYDVLLRLYIKSGFMYFLLIVVVVQLNVGDVV